MVEKIEVNLIPAEYRIHNTSFVIKKEILIPSIITAVLITISLGWVNILDKNIAAKDAIIAAQAKEIKSYEAEERKLNQQIKAENDIAEMATKARAGKISIDELQGGTFSITNGGIFGSMLSTPILNPPQAAILKQLRR